MPKPRYDKEKNETRHVAVSEEYCEDMADTYGWTLKQGELVAIDVLPVLPVELRF
jgi:hypothetical protein